MADDDKGGLLGEFEEFLAAKRKAAEDAAASEYDGDDFEWWDEDKDGGRRGGRTTVRAARNHGPDWVKSFFASPDDGKDKGDGKGGGDQGDQGGKPVPALFPRSARKPAAGQ